MILIGYKKQINCELYCFVQQKPWFYDLREVWAGFPKQVSATYGKTKCYKSKDEHSVRSTVKTILNICMLFQEGCVCASMFEWRLVFKYVCFV